MRSVVIFCFLALGSHCAASLDVQDLPPAEQRVELEALRVEPAYDVYALRVDLFRRTSRVVVQNADGSMGTREQPLPYHYVGASLGNGLFLDANMNLSLDIVRLAGLEASRGFRIETTTGGVMARSTTIARSGDEAVVSRAGFFAGDSKATFHPGGVSLQGGWLSGRQEITVADHEIVYDPFGVFGNWSQTRVRRVENGVEIPGLWSGSRVLLLNDEVRFGGNLSIQYEGRQLRLVFSGLFGDRGKTLTRSRNRLAFFDDNLRGFTVDFT
ncbi:MAG: hypothetical protein RIF32_21465, partial [Leptospirales bacterium]